MKTLKIGLLLATLLIVQNVNSQDKKKKDHSNHHYTSFSINGNNPDISSGFWTAIREDDVIYLQFSDNSRHKNFSFNIGHAIPTREFNMSGSSFNLVREAGTIAFEGSFNGTRGTGEYVFTRNKDFESFLAKEGIRDGMDYYFFKMFLGNVDRDYVLGVKSEGYQPTMKQLGKLGILDVSLEYISDIGKTNYKGLELDMLVKFHIHGVNREYIDGLAKLGYDELESNMLKKFAVHSISLDYIKGLNNAGYSNMDPNMVKKFAIHSVTPKYIQGLNNLGYKNLDPNTIKNFAVHSISLDYIKSLMDLNIDKPSTSQIRKAKIHNVSANFIERAMRKGHKTSDLSDYIKLKIHGI